MKAHRFGLTDVAVASVATAIGAGAAVTGDTPPWLKALNERSEALNRQYGLGDHAERRQLGAPGPDWLVALNARSEAMNRYYGLGEYAGPVDVEIRMPGGRRWAWKQLPSDRLHVLTLSESAALRR